MAAKALGVRQKNFNVAQLKDACKRAVEAAAKEAHEEEELEAGRLQPLEAKRDFDAMNQVELRKAAKEFGVSQGGSVAELKVVCKRHVREQPKQRNLMMWMVGNAPVVELAAAPPDTNPAHSGAGAVFGAVQKKTTTAENIDCADGGGGNARVAESAAAPPGSNPEHSGAGTGPGTARQALPAAWKRIAAKPTWLRSKGRLAKRQQERATPRFKAKRQQYHATPRF